MAGRAVAVVGDDARFQRTVAAHLPRSVPLETVTPAEYSERALRADYLGAVVDEVECTPEFASVVTRLATLGIAAPLVLLRPSAAHDTSDLRRWALAVMTHSE